VKKTKKTSTEPDSLFVLKLILLVFVGGLWLRVTVDGSLVGLPLPIGFLLGLVLVSKDHFQIDRKIEYAVLVATMFISFFLPFGIVVALQ
jgi:hypothetical protein